MPDHLHSDEDALSSGHVGRDVPDDTSAARVSHASGRASADHVSTRGGAWSEPSGDREALRGPGECGPHHPHQTLAEVRRAHGRGPTGPYAGPRKGLNYERRMQRYNILRCLGVRYTEAHKAAYSAAGFVASLTEAGGDPSLYPELGRKLQSGPPRKEGPLNRARIERYARLKLLGLDASKASKYSNSAGVYARALRLIEQGLPL